MEELKGKESSIEIKLVVFYIFMFIDIIFASFIDVGFDLSLSENKNIPAIEVSIVQIVITLILIIIFFVLLWSTFPLRQGMLGELLKYFKWPIFFGIFFLTLHAIERVVRMMAYIKSKSTADSDVWDNNFYRILYYLKYLLYPVFYGVLIDGAQKLSMPHFYKPDPWIEK